MEHSNFSEYIYEYIYTYPCVNLKVRFLFYVFNKLTKCFKMSVTPCSALGIRTTYF